MTDTNKRLAAITAAYANDEGIAYFTTGELRTLMVDPDTGIRPSNAGIRRLIRKAIHVGYLSEGSHNRKLSLPTD